LVADPDKISATDRGGLQNTRGQVYTGGLSMLHDFNSRITLGAELYGGYAENDTLGKSQLQAMQLQAMVGGQYALRHGLSFCFGLLGGKYVASPQIGGQIGFAMDLPDLWISARRHSGVQ